jgi:hypothetical protein
MARMEERVLGGRGGGQVEILRSGPPVASLTWSGVEPEETSPIEEELAWMRRERVLGCQLMMLEQLKSV